MQRRSIILAAAGLAALAACVAVFIPGVSGAWPWDDNRDILVTGNIQCKGFDAGSDTPFYPYSKVQGFEIKGQSNVAKISNDGWTATYDVMVPVGWRIEWSLKCSNRSKWLDNSFEVKKSGFGSSYQQTRHICTQDGSLVSTCGSRKLGYCLELLIQRKLTSRLPYSSAFRILYEKFGDAGGTSATDCANALRDSTPNLSSPALPEPEGEEPYIPDPGYESESPIDPLGPEGSEESAGTTDDQDQDQDQDQPMVTSTGVVNGCNTYGQNCDGNPIYVNVPPQGYDYRVEPKVDAVPNGTHLAARCWTSGPTVFNWAISQNDPGPNRYESDVFFNVQAPSGSWGYIPDTYFVRDKGGKLGLSAC